MTPFALSGDIETGRLLLRPFKLTDARDMFAYARDERVGPNAGWKPHESLSESLFIIRRFIVEQDVMAIFHRADRRVIGSIGLHKRGDASREANEIEDESLSGLAKQTISKITPLSTTDALNKTREGSLELGYVLSADYWGGGIMTEAARAVMSRAFNELKLYALTVSHFPHNERSRRVIEKCGFEYERTVPGGFTRRHDGVKMDEVRYRLTYAAYAARGNKA